MSTITTDPKVLATRFNQAFNAHDEKTLSSLIAPNSRFTAPGDIRLEGKEAVLAYTYGWLKAFPERREEARVMLSGLHEHLGQTGIGSVSEIFDAEAPFTARGCIAQAWSVAEVLRCWVETTERGQV